jgi:hypothetical protein
MIRPRELYVPRENRLGRISANGLKFHESVGGNACRLVKFYLDGGKKTAEGKEQYMYQLKRRIVPVVAAGFIGLGVSAARAAQPTTQPASQQDLQSQVDQLKAQVQALQAKNTENQADVTAAIQHVLNDADQHSQMLEVTGGTAGYDPAKGIQITDDAGNFLVHPWLQLQARYAADYRSKASQSVENGFEIRRMKIGFDGYVFSPSVTYLFQ